MITLLATLLSSMAVSPTPSRRTSPAPYTWSGEIYQGSKPVYFMFVKPKDTQTTTVHGFISRYSFLTEYDTEFPVAFVNFVEDGSHEAREIDIAVPLRINGQVLQCAVDKSKSSFEQRYHICPALPKDVVGREHPVSLHVFDSKYPDGSPATVTSEIDSTSNH